MRRHGRLYRSDEDDEQYGRRCEGVPQHGHGQCSDGVGKEACVPKAVGALHALEGTHSVTDRQPLPGAAVEGRTGTHAEDIVGSEV